VGLVRLPTADFNPFLESRIVRPVVAHCQLGGQLVGAGWLDRLVMQDANISFSARVSGVSDLRTGSCGGFRPLFVMQFMQGAMNPSLNKRKRRERRRAAGHTIARWLRFPFQVFEGTDGKPGDVNLWRIGS